MKFLARRFFPSLSRAMAVALLLSVLEILVLAAQPSWHERLHHHDADHGEEECAVTLFASGSWHHAAALPIVVPMLALLPDEVVEDRSWFVYSFSFSGILEHAPPRRA